MGRVQFKHLLATAVLVGGITSLSAGVELIQNGSFENFTVTKDHGKWKKVTFDNWVGEGEVWGHALGRVATKGTHKAELDVGRRSVNSLTQTITTVEGEAYLLSLDAYGRKANSSDFELFVDGESLLQVTPTREWKKYGIKFTGGGGEQEVMIREIDAQDNGVGTVIDNFSIQSDTSLAQLKAAQRSLYDIMEPSGLGQILEIIDNDRIVQARYQEADIVNAKSAAERMNSLINEAIMQLGLANDGIVSVADTREINRYLVANFSGEWRTLRADYAVIERYSETDALNINAIKDLWGSLYNLGFEPINRHRLANIAGKKSTHFSTVGYRLGEVVKGDILNGSLNNPDYEEVRGTTETGMDRIVHVILNDRGLLKNVLTSDLRAGAEAADGMNHLIMEAIIEEGLGNDGKLTTADIRTINNYLVTNHKEQWALLHGDDETGEETGYHRIQNDGATTRAYADNVMNSIADGVYHLGFPTRFKNNLENEDGNKNKRFEKVAWWMDSYLKEDLEAGKFNNPNYEEVTGTTSTTFDRIIPLIYHDEGLLLRVSMEDIRGGARAANGMNELIIEAIRAVGAATDHYISVDEVKAMNRYLVANHQARWAELHGDDETGEETGYHRIQNDGAVSNGYGKNIINKLADGVYHLGFPTRFEKNLENEDGNKNVSFNSVAYWMNKALEEDLASGVLE
jgi:hypothetical protein